MATKKTGPTKKTAKRKVGTKKQAAKQEESKPTHPLMLDGLNWDRLKVMDHICDQLATTSKGLGSILLAGYEGATLPSYSQIMRWADDDSALRDMYARAKEAQADFMADETLRIADDEADDVIMVDGVPLQVDGKLLKTKTGPSVQHARLRVDARKWLASKLKPKKYGDKTEIEHSGSIQTLPDEQVDARLAALLAKVTKAE